MAGDLTEMVPGFDPVASAVDTTMLAGLASIPVGGGAMVEIASGLIDQARARRQYEFDMAVAKAIEELQDEEGHPTVSEVLESVEFMAAYERASRAAAESSSLDHRMTLARAAAQMGPWSGVSEALRNQMFSIVNDMQEAHARVLMFLDDPRRFIAPLDPNNLIDALEMASLPDLIIEWVFARVVGSQELTTIVLKFLEDRQLAQAPKAMMNAQAALSCHTTQFGRDLLHFIQFPRS